MFSSAIKMECNVQYTYDSVAILSIFVLIYTVYCRYIHGWLMENAGYRKERVSLSI